MSAPPAVGPGRYNWQALRHVLESIVIAVILQGLVLATVVAGDRLYRVAIASAGATSTGYLRRPGEEGLVVVLALSVGAWLSGVWLAERHPGAWGWPAVATIVLCAGLLLWLDSQLVPVPGTPPVRLIASNQSLTISRALAAIGWFAGIIAGAVTGDWWTSRRAAGSTPTDADVPPA